MGGTIEISPQDCSNLSKDKFGPFDQSVFAERILVERTLISCNLLHFFRDVLHFCADLYNIQFDHGSLIQFGLGGLIIGYAGIFLPLLFLLAGWHVGRNIFRGS